MFKDLPQSRKDALELSSEYYFLARKCQNGHIDKRVTATRHCVSCEKAGVYKIAAEKRKATRKSYYEKNAQKYRDYAKAYHSKNRERILSEMKARNKEYYKANSDRIKANVRRYVADNKEWRRKYAREWASEKFKSDPYFKMARVSRRLLMRTLGVGGEKKTKRTWEHLGYDAQQLSNHLEAQFTHKMSWSNYGEYWHIDHIIPIKWFFDNGITDPKEVNALTNLKPLRVEDNLKKGSKVLYLL